VEPRTPPTSLPPQTVAILRATGAYAPSYATATRSPAAQARAAAVERALKRGRMIAAQAPRKPPPPRPPAELDPDRLMIALALVFVLLLEIVGGIIAFALPHGYFMLAFGLALDACARTLGAVATSREGIDWGPGWRWACIFIGSPAVVLFAFFDDGDSDLAPLAGPVSAFAIVCVAIGLIGIPAGI
jgi:hypothetical protein